MTLYADLGITPDADDAAILAAYRKLAMEHHPDRKNGSTEQFQRIKKAYEVLSDPDRRKRYDESGAMEDVMDQNEAHKHLAAIFLEAINRPDFDERYDDPVAIIKVGILNAKKEIERQIKSLEEFNAKRLRIVARMNPKDENILIAVIESDVRMRKQQIEETGKQMAKLDELLGLLEGHGYNAEERQQQQSPFHSQLMNQLNQQQYGYQNSRQQDPWAGVR